jgi:hypothetical protein
LHNSKPLNTSAKDIEPLHRFHTYCARFPSGLAEAAINAYTKSGDSLFDPFCGSGTSLVAGLAHSRGVVGVDIDVLAGMLSEVKCFVRRPQDYQQWRLRFAKTLSRIFKEIEQKWSPSIILSPASSVSLGSLLFKLPRFHNLTIGFLLNLSLPWPPSLRQHGNAKILILKRWLSLVYPHRLSRSGQAP